MLASPLALTAATPGPARILWIEHDEVVSGWGCQFLARAGCTVTLAPTGTAGLALSGFGGYDLIILDWQLPDMSGEDVLSALVAAGVQTPVMVCTGYSDDGEERAARSAGAWDFYSKPLCGPVWIERIEAMIGPVKEETASARHLRWHDHLLNGDSGFRDEVAAEFLPLLGGRLRRRWPGTDTALIGTAVNDTLMEYFRAPSSYDRLRLPLDGYLALISRRRFQNVQRGVHRRRQHEEAVGDALPDHPGALEITISRYRDLRAVLKVCGTGGERAFMHARLRGENRTPELAVILGLAHLSPPAQRAGVHRVIDRLRLRIQRSRQASGRAQ